MEFKEVKIEIFVPGEYVTKLREELNKINAIKVGDYDNVLSITQVRGFWRPLPGAVPFHGKVNEICEGEECKVEIRCKVEHAREAIKTIKEIHPYEEPVINIIPLVNELFE